MRSCSDSIAQLASALAKAQIELVNPAKTMTGVIDRWGSGNEGQSYRYAPLSAGLEIVRNTLCKHELAVIQTTELDQESGLVMLTTTLAHGSGEWVSASWPVCRAADMTNPKLMGAALTYARRYGLFTLVGIAGEDDLDAPEIPVAPDGERRETSEVRPNGGGRAHGSELESVLASPALNARIAGQSAAAQVDQARTRPRKQRRAVGISRGTRALAAGSVEFALNELAAIESSDALFRWVLAVLPFRNSLSESSRAALDATFFEKADEVGADPDIFLALTPPAAHRNGAAGREPQA
ncbi:MAG: single-stranded DNA-binding protein [Microvirga sp.]|nr:single-stranded DNA-binding protein [Microvirga sp.]